MKQSKSTDRRRFLQRTLGAAALLGASAPAASLGAVEKSSALAKCRVVPLPNQEVSFSLNGAERLRWHAGEQYPRPFFFPFLGPSGALLTRMGHPGAPNHDHHRSLWFAHHDVDGMDFWSDNTSTRIRQKQWLCYIDGDNQATMAVSLGWYSGAGSREVMEQILIAMLRPGSDGDAFLELQSTFRPATDPVKLGRTNFGFLAVRVAKSISEYFGGGRLSDSEGRTAEAQIFGKRAAWMDYSGPVDEGQIEGITYFDHPDNPGYPTHWHVREDGWMGASFCMENERTITREEPLKLRYLLHAHRDFPRAREATAALEAFAKAPAYEVGPSQAKHRQFELRMK